MSYGRYLLVVGLMGGAIHAKRYNTAAGARRAFLRLKKRYTVIWCVSNEFGLNFAVDAKVSGSYSCGSGGPNPYCKPTWLDRPFKSQAAEVTA